MKMHAYPFALGIFFLLGTLIVPLQSSADEAEGNATQPISPVQSAKAASGPDCRGCHADYYKKWDLSPHGTCLRQVDEKLISSLQLPKHIFSYGQTSFAIASKGNSLQMLESEPEGETTYDITYAIGGKQFFYFLTPLEKGHLQLLPLAYDIERKEWFDAARIDIPHIPARQPGTAPQLWKQRAFSFSTICSHCHVNSYSHSYNLEHDSYPPIDQASGLDCASCHGPGKTHAANRKANQADATKQQSGTADDIIRGGSAFSNKQVNDNCAVCHALALPLTTGFKPGDDFSDNFSLITLEHPAFYPDGRAKGETFVYGSWQLSPCALSGKLNCLHCHTPGGNFRFKDDPNKACSPCHADIVNNPVPHTHHAAETDAGKCITCHMPQHQAGSLRETDHSMLPPTPALSKAFGSPNSCNSCHTDKDIDWADNQVRKWQTHDYQAPLLKRAGLIAAARQKDWNRLPEMISYLSDAGHNDFFTASLLRLLSGYNSQELWKIVLKLQNDPSPIVRAAVIAYLGRSACPDAFPSLVHAIGDQTLLVRIQAALELSQIPIKGFPMIIQVQMKNAMTEYVGSLIARPDQWNAHYQMGTLFARQGNRKVARSAYEKALELEPHALPALVNLSLLQLQSGELPKAEETIRKALKLAPDNIQALLNLGVILGKKGDRKGSEATLRQILELDPNQAEAAFNLAVLLAQNKDQDHLKEALQYARQAYELRPEDTRYAFALAFYLNSTKQQAEALAILQKAMKQRPNVPDLYLLLGEIQTEQGDKQGAIATYNAGMQMKGATEKFKKLLSQRLQKLTGVSSETQQTEQSETTKSNEKE